MISELTLKFGRAPGAPTIPITLTPVTVFVGPNNSGKSKLLTEIDNYCSFGPQDNNYLLDQLLFSNKSPESAASYIEQVSVQPNVNETVYQNHIIVGSRKGRSQVPRADLMQIIQTPSVNYQAYTQWFLTHFILKLDGQSRIGLINSQSAGDLQQPTHSSFQVLFRDNAKRREVRRIIKDAFGVYFVLDPTNIGQFRIRLSSREPANETEERGLHEAAVRFHAEAQLIDVASDGVKAFTGIITEVVAGDPKILLIDEPEAFLHPSLAYKLGYELSRASIEQDKRVFVSTHSPAFVMGCIQSGSPINIVRLTYRESVATARLLPSADLLKLMRNPLLRSTGVLSGLFYEFVIVTEADADRAFYQEVNERLLRYRPEWGIPNCLFLHAQNKQTVQTIIRPLRELGIPAAAIVDIDILKEGGTPWGGFLSSSGAPAISHAALATHRSSVMQAFTSSGRNMKRDGGVSVLSGEEQEAALNLLHSLAEYGMFVVPGGELESWLKHLGASGHGPNWLISIFESMGEDPDSPNYLRPGNNDVWAFFAKIRSWLMDPSRKGIPG